MRARPGKGTSPIALALGLGAGLGLAGCATHPAPAVVAPVSGAPGSPSAGRHAAQVGVIVALRPVPADTLGLDPAAFSADGRAPAATAPEPAYTEIVIRERDGRTRVVVQPRAAAFVPGRQVRLAAHRAVLLSKPRKVYVTN
jgi:outer membrane lipoprotein SlyB